MVKGPSKQSLSLVVWLQIARLEAHQHLGERDERVGFGLGDSSRKVEWNVGAGVFVVQSTARTERKRKVSPLETGHKLNNIGRKRERA